ncbi:hypothetical protein GCM10010862_27230 [Devosia nitrariae]|uniref:MFS transporter n=1 Tax=Devosia nitrariae TaxID=2071872 RepID=A0ABQ5W5X3_9HYPH|nr:hypothetical protein GCM10010862_27230 [Devosia nitrariae]
MSGYVLFSLGLAPVFTLATDPIVGTAPPERAGAASAIAETSSELGGALGIAILGSIVTAIYRSAMASAVPPGVPHQAADAARDTLGGALAVAQQLPEMTGARCSAPLAKHSARRSRQRSSFALPLLWLQRSSQWSCCAALEWRRARAATGAGWWQRWERRATGGGRRALNRERIGSDSRQYQGRTRAADHADRTP